MAWKRSPVRSRPGPPFSTTYGFRTPSLVGLLKIVRDRRDSGGITSEYLYGATRDGPGGALPRRPGLPPLPDQSEGGRSGVEPYGGRVRLSPRSLVESRGGSAGRRSRPSYRTDAAG